MLNEQKLHEQKLHEQKIKDENVCFICYKKETVEKSGFYLEDENEKPKEFEGIGLSAIRKYAMKHNISMDDVLIVRLTDGLWHFFQKKYKTEGGFKDNPFLPKIETLKKRKSNEPKYRLIWKNIK